MKKEASKRKKALNKDQLEIYENIEKAVKERKITSNGNCFYLDGPGGTGKTFLYIAIYFLLRAMGIKVICVASTGIAATLLPGGRTAHSVFGLDVPLRPDSESKIIPNTKPAKILNEVQVIIWDEAPASNKYALQCADKILRKIMKEPGSPFGGKIMLLGGDFRQCLPVLKMGNRSEKLDICIKMSDLWKHFKTFSLIINERVNQALKSNNIHEMEELERFSRWILAVNFILF